MDKGKSMTGCVYMRKDFPKIDYEVALEGKKVDGGDFFCTTTFPVGDSFLLLVVGGWGGGVVGISSINGADASENETHQSREFKSDRWYKVRIRVTTPKVEAWIDDDKVIDLQREGRKLTTRIECRECGTLRFRHVRHDRGRPQHQGVRADGGGEESRRGEEERVKSF